MRAQKLLVGLYYSHIDWHYPTGNWHQDTKIDETFIAAHPQQWHDFANYEQGQILELISKYGQLDLFWFDVSWPRWNRRCPPDADHDAVLAAANADQ